MQKTGHTGCGLAYVESYGTEHGNRYQCSDWRNRCVMHHHGALSPQIVPKLGSRAYRY